MDRLAPEMKLSEIIWKAANEYLVPPEPYDKSDEMWRFTCCAVAAAEGCYDRFFGGLWLDSSSAVAFLRSLGWENFDDHAYNEGVQSMRYLSLMFAYWVAVDFENGVIKL